MGKIYLYYKKHNDLLVGNVLKVKIDNEIELEIKKNELYEQNISDGPHNIKMYAQGWTENDLMGYIDRDIEINGDTYFTYNCPRTTLSKGKLIQNKFNNPTEFKKSIEKGNKKFIIIYIIILILILILFV